MKTMIAQYLLHNKTLSNNAKVAIGLTALTGAALIYAIPSTRKACLNLFKRIAAKKQRVLNDNANKWEQNFNSAEKLKGSLTKRKNPSIIKIENVATTAWKDDWLSE